MKVPGPLEIGAPITGSPAVAGGVVILAGLAMALGEPAPATPLSEVVELVAAE